MEFPNAFIGKKTPPTSRDVVSRLGKSAPAWSELVQWLKQQGLACNEWHSVSPKYGWALLSVLKTRRIAYLAPCDGCFRVSFVLGDNAITAARASNLPKSVLNEIAKSRRYAEGTGVRLMVNKPDDLPAIMKLVEIKLQN